MNLKDYLKASRLTQIEFAARIHSTPATVSRLCAGAFKPSLELAHLIERETLGSVPTEIWITPAAQSGRAA